MELKVIYNDEQAAGQAEPWYAGGLRFTCTQCGNCCTGGPGYVWISKEEIERLAGHLQLTPGQVVNRYCRRVDGKYSLKENRNERGEYDCIFLKEERVASPDSNGNGDGEQILYTKRTCTIYHFRPLQCRTWPFWSENLRSKENWQRSSRRCHGMNAGKRIFSRQEMEALRDAKDWPENPPTSGTK